MCVLPLYIHVHLVCVSCRQRSEEGIGSIPETRNAKSYKPGNRGLELTSGLLQEQDIHLTSELSFQLSDFSFGFRRLRQNITIKPRLPPNTQQ